MDSSGNQSLFSNLPTQSQFHSSNGHLPPLNTERIHDVEQATPVNIPSPTTTPPPPQSCISYEHKLAMDERRNVLQAEELKLEKSLNDVPLFFSSHLNSFGIIVICAINPLSGAVVRDVDKIYYFLGLIAFHYLGEMLVVSMLGFKKVQRLFWRMSFLKGKRAILEADVKVLMKAMSKDVVSMEPSDRNPVLLVAKSQLREIINTIDISTGYFKLDYIVYWAVSSFVSTSLPLTVIAWLCYLRVYQKLPPKMNMFPSPGHILSNGTRI